jgi:acetyl esterase
MNAPLLREDKLDPEIVALLKEQVAKFGVIELTDLPPAEARPLFLARNAIFNTRAVAATTRDFDIPTRAGSARARSYRTPGAAGTGAILHFHGGGWTFGNIDSHDSLLRSLAKASGDTVIAIDYRLAPEFPFPAPLEDCVDAFVWCAKNAASIGIEAARIAVAGDSAGANLALAVSLALRDEAFHPAAMLLFYGCYQTTTDTPSHRQFGDGRFGLSSERMRRFWVNYIGAALKSSPLATPLTADMRGLPPAHLMVGTLDVLHDDTITLAEKLKAAKIPHDLQIHRGAHHGFLHMDERAAIAHNAIEAAARYWRLVPR